MTKTDIGYRDGIRFQLEHARRMTQTLIDEFKTRDQWLFQPHPDANNAIWIIGHLGLADNFMMSLLRPDGDEKPESLQSKYWYGSKPSGVDSENVSAEEALAYFRNRREHLMSVFDSYTEDEWHAKPPEDSPFGNFPTMGHVFFFNTMHEGIHFGQLTVCHRALGNPPLK